MKLFVTLVVLFLVSGVTHGGCCECTLSDLLSLDTYIKSGVKAALQNSKLTCTDVNAKGALVSCPDSYIATSCSCGSACGSWDIRSDTTCHCQCNNIDWTSARCCKTA